MRCSTSVYRYLSNDRNRRPCPEQPPSPMGCLLNRSMLHPPPCTVGTKAFLLLRRSPYEIYVGKRFESSRQWSSLTAIQLTANACSPIMSVSSLVVSHSSIQCHAFIYLDIGHACKAPKGCCCGHGVFIANEK
jgi:hypothetical protein